MRDFGIFHVTLNSLLFFLFELCLFIRVHLLQFILALHCLVHFVLFELLVTLGIEIAHICRHRLDQAIEILEAEVFDVFRVDVSRNIIHQRLHIHLLALVESTLC